MVKGPNEAIIGKHFRLTRGPDVGSIKWLYWHDINILFRFPTFLYPHYFYHHKKVPLEGATNVTCTVV